MAFVRTCGSCRFVRNLALEQRRMFGRKGRLIGYTAQAKDLPELRAELDWLRDVPNQCLQQALVDLDTAFQRFFAGEAGYPKFHKRVEHDSFRFPAITRRQVVKKDGAVVRDERGAPVWKTYEVVGLGPDWIDLPKIGKVRMVRHRALEGEPKSVTIVRDSEDWYAAIVCAVEVADPWDDGGRPATAYDVGAIRDFGMPDGTVFDVPGPTPGEEVRKLKLERRIARCVEARKKPPSSVPRVFAATPLWSEIEPFVRAVQAPGEAIGGVLPAGTRCAPWRPQARRGS